MTCKELISLLTIQKPSCLDYDLFVENPDATDDYFVATLGIDDTQKQVFIKTEK